MKDCRSKQEFVARLQLDAEHEVQVAHDSLCIAIAKLRAAGVVEGRLSPEIEDAYLDLNGSAGPLDRMLKLGTLSKASREGAS